MHLEFSSEKIYQNNWLQLKSVVGIWKANSNGDDILLKDSENNIIQTFCTLRQQSVKSNNNLALSDYIAPQEIGYDDYIGAFVCTAGLGIEKPLANYENELLKYCTKKLSEIGDIQIYGHSINKIAVISFNVKGIHAYDIGSILDKLGIAVRTGQHCAQPIMDFYQIPGTVRVSFSFYNTKEEIDFFILGLQKAIKMLR